MKLICFIPILLLAGCSSWESKFTSHVGCPEEEIQVLKRSQNLLGVQDHTVSCRGVVYHCTETMKDFVPGELRCRKSLAKRSLSNSK